MATRPSFFFKAPDSTIVEMASQAPLLGLPSGKETIYEETIDVEEGDKLLLFTDGITETFGKAQEEYGEGKGGREFLKENSGLDPVKFNERLMKAVTTFKEGPARDDICIVSMGIKAHGGLFHFLRGKTLKINLKKKPENMYNI